MEIVWENILLQLFIVLVLVLLVGGAVFAITRRGRRK